MATSYLNSDQVTVFPSGFRSDSYQAAKLTTEQNLTYSKIVSTYAANNNCFFADPFSSDRYIIYIRGYYFSVSSIPAGTPLCAYIKLRTIDTTVVGAVLDNIAGSTDHILDVGDEFQGLGFDSSIPNGCIGVQVRGDSGQLLYQNFKFSTSEIRNSSDGSGTKGIDEELNTTTLKVGPTGSYNTLVVDGPSGTVSVSGTLGVTGAVNLNGDLSVTGTTTLNGALGVSGNVSVTGAITASSTINGLTLNNNNNDVVVKNGDNGLVVKEGKNVTANANFIVGPTGNTSYDIIINEYTQEDNNHAIQLSVSGTTGSSTLHLPKDIDDETTAAFVQTNDGTTLKAGWIGVSSVSGNASTIVQRDSSGYINVTGINGSSIPTQNSVIGKQCVESLTGTVSNMQVPTALAVTNYAISKSVIGPTGSIVYGTGAGPVGLSITEDAILTSTTGPTGTIIPQWETKDSVTVGTAKKLEDSNNPVTGVTFTSNIHHNNGTKNTSALLIDTTSSDNDLEQISVRQFNSESTSSAKNELKLLGTDGYTTIPNKLTISGTSISSGKALEITKGGAKITAGGLEVAAGGLNVTGGLTVSSGGASVTGTITASSSIISSVTGTAKAFQTSGDSPSFYVTGAGNVTANSYNATSDIRKKENIKDFKPLKSILKLPIKRFDYIDGPKNQIGCIAQDLIDICPEIVNRDEDGYLSIQESKIVYLLLDEVKKLKDEVKDLKKKVRDIERGN